MEIEDLVNATEMVVKLECLKLAVTLYGPGPLKVSEVLDISETLRGYVLAGEQADEDLPF
jgi:hypothetical protein